MPQEGELSGDEGIAVNFAKLPLLVWVAHEVEMRAKEMPVTHDLCIRKGSAAFAIGGTPIARVALSSTGAKVIRCFRKGTDPRRFKTAVAHDNVALDAFVIADCLVALMQEFSGTMPSRT